MGNPEILRAIADGSKKWEFGPNALISLVAILIVFCVLLIIIGLTVLISKFIKEKKVTDNVKQISSSNAQSVKFDENDEDMMMAVMVATIDYREETKQDVTLVDLKEIKE